MRELITEIDISASPERVWDILIDFDQYPEWNPFIIVAEGIVSKGNRLRVRIEPTGRKAMTFKSVIRLVLLNRELRWLGRLLIPGLFDGEHSFCLRSIRVVTT